MLCVLFRNASLSTTTYVLIEKYEKQRLAEQCLVWRYGDLDFVFAYVQDTGWEKSHYLITAKAKISLHI